MAADASSFWHELKSHDYDCDDGLCNSVILFLSVALAILFSGISARPKMCSEFTTAGEMAKLAMKIENHRASHCLLFRCLRKTLLFFFVVKYKNVSKRCFQSRPFEPNNKKAHSFSRKSQAADAKSKWAKIETGFGFGYRWEMFVSRCCGGAEQTGPEEKKKFAIGRVFLAHWVSWLHQTGPLRRGQFMSFWSAIVIPISCVSIAPRIARLINIIGSVLCELLLMITNYALKPPKTASA